MPISLGLGTLQAPAVNVALLSREPVETTSKSTGVEENENVLEDEEEPVLLEEQAQEGEQLANAFSRKITITKPNTENTFAFGFNAISSTKMATTTMLTSTIIRGFAQGEDVNIYHAALMAPGGGQDGEGGHGFASGGHSFVSGGRGPLPQDSGQPHQGRGGHGGPPGSLPGGGGSSSGAPGEGGGRGPNPLPVPPFRLPAPATNGGLKGTMPAIFNGNRKNTKQYTQEFTLYRLINQDSNTM